MCDERTQAENEAFLAAQIQRRQLGLGAGAALLVGCGPKTSPPQASSNSPASPPPQGNDVVPARTQDGSTMGRIVTIETPDGSAEAFFVAPAQGRHRAVLIWPDVAGLRDAFEQMATRLAGEGYAALAVNPYYRSSSLPILETFSEWTTEEGKAKIAPMREALTDDAIARDAAAFVAWLDTQPQVDPARKIGTTGYCMGGPFTVRTAAAAPERVGAIGSFHGGGLVREGEDSPHLLFETMQAAALICIAENDDARDPEVKVVLRKAAQDAGRAAEIEVYPAQHGWCVTDSPVYDQAQAERAWSRMLATFDAEL